MTSKSIKPEFRLLIIISLATLIAVFFIGLGDAKTPLILSFIFAYFSHPLIIRMEKLGTPRLLSVVLFFTIIFVLLGLITLFALPALIQDFGDLLKSLPSFLTTVISKIESYFLANNLKINISKSELTDSLQKGVKNHSGDILKYMLSGFSGAFTSVTSFVLSVLNLTLFPVFFYYLVYDYEKITKSLFDLIPRSFQKHFSRYLVLMNSVLSGFFRGQLIVASILGILYSLSLSLIGLKYGFVIGLFSGAISLIPYAGLFIGLSMAIIVSIANDGNTLELISIVASFGVIQALEGFIITPRFVGNNVGLNPFTTILALIIWGNLLGFLGLLIGIPLTAIFQNLTLELIKEYKNMNL